MKRTEAGVSPDVQNQSTLRLTPVAEVGTVVSSCISETVPTSKGQMPEVEGGTEASGPAGSAGPVRFVLTSHHWAEPSKGSTQGPIWNTMSGMMSCTPLVLSQPSQSGAPPGTRVPPV